MIIAFAVGLTVGFTIGMLVYRKNKVHLEAIITNLKDQLNNRE